jgi:hypothetical protein
MQNPVKCEYCYHDRRGKSSSRSSQYSSQLWQGAQRTHSGGSSQGIKRRADSDPRLDPSYDSKRARSGTSAKSAEANGHSSPGKHEADAGTAPDLQGTSSGNTTLFCVATYCMILSSIDYSFKSLS